MTYFCCRMVKKKLVWSENKSDRVNHKNGCNMTVHRDYANKSCPGDYLYNRHGEIAAEVNRRLGAAEPPKPDTAPTGTLYKVQIGAFSKKANAAALEKKVKAAGFDTFVTKEGTLYKVQVGAFSVKANAEAIQKKLSAAGYSDAFITASSGTAAKPSAPAAAKITEGSRVRLKQGAPTYTGGSLASYVYDRVHVVKEISGKRAVITFGNIVVAAVNVDDLTLA